MYIVYYCVQDYEDVWRREVARFDTELKAEEYMDLQNPCIGDWYEIGYES
jgi:hypothetical protein